MEERGELCLQEEVLRLWDQGISEEEISRQMGLDPGWVEATISAFSPEESTLG